ncbi:RHS repeat domain-containing protein, partial [Xanthomonas sacchari]|uniref:RHS repeat domain-containing protein n=1 Tax=Xanthomonas sacchari TaxID=56458 RepID=UPI00225DF9C0
MVAVFTGNGLGLFDSSLSKLGAANGGAAGLGRGQDRQFINVANGNLVLQGRDEFLNFRGLPISMVRTYNSFGQVSDTGNDGWVTGFERRVELVGTLGASDSKVRLQMGDGQSVEFLYDADSQTYQTTAGSGAKDTIAWDASAKTWTYTEGSTRQQEVYADHADGQLRGRLLKIVSSTTDAAAPAEFDLVYDSAGHVTEVRSANGTQTGDAMLFAYDAQGRLTGLSTRESGVVLTQAAYEYDALGRLTAVVADLTPGDATDNTWDATNLASNDGLRFRTEYTYAGDSLRIASVRQSDGFLVSY